MRIIPNGNVGIGNSNPDAKLTVTGLVHAQEVKVTVNAPGPDYVFEKNYKLTTLKKSKTISIKINICQGFFSESDGKNGVHW